VLVFTPTNYDASDAWPLVIVLHGAAGSQAAAANAASSMRALWQSVAQNNGIVLMAPIASGAMGGWVPALDTPAIACALEEAERRYNIDRTRRTLWGFSAGGHYGHSIALGNATRFAAYAVNAGVLFALACAPPAQPNSCESTLPAAGRRIPVGIRVGVADSLQAYAEDDAVRFDSAGWTPGADLVYSQFAGGHTVAVSDATWAWEWLAPWQLSP
jgi:poly(3-hydroxybutyrate) depolymerase